MKSMFRVAMSLLITTLFSTLAFAGEPATGSLLDNAHPHARAWLIGVFAVIIVGFLVFDLGFMNKKAHGVTTKAATLQTLFWIAVAVGYGGLIYYFVGHEPAAQFFSAYITEKMLSADNLMVIMMLFMFFDVKEAFQHRVLYWGILGAVVLRGLFIGSGTLIVSLFHPVLYLFGAVLIWSGIKLMASGDDEEAQDFEKNRTLIFLKKWLPLSSGPHTGHFFTIENGKKVGTILLLTLAMVEVTDLIFAVDSIPAVFAITTDFFIAFTSNIFAVMGLRALFFIVEKVLKQFPHLQKGIAFVLVFIGGKMFLDLVDPAVGFLSKVFGFAHTEGSWEYHLTSVQSFMVIIIALGLAMGYSVISVKMGWTTIDDPEAAFDDSDLKPATPATNENS